MTDIQDVEAAWETALRGLLESVKQVKAHYPSVPMDEVVERARLVEEQAAALKLAYSEEQLDVPVAGLEPQAESDSS